MRRPSATGERLFFLFLIGVFLFNPPALSIFDVPRQVFGIPLLYLYLFACWGAMLLLVVFIIERWSGPDEAPDTREDAAGEDGNA